MKQITAVIISVIFFIIYVISVNLVATYILTTSYIGPFDTSSQMIGGANVNLGMGDSVSVMVERNRWYGKIYILAGERSDLYLFNIIQIPFEVKGNSWIAYHWTFFIILGIFIYSQKDERRGIYYETTL